MTATVFGSVCRRNIQVALPSVFQRGIRKSPSCSSALARAVSLCERTTSTRLREAVGDPVVDHLLDDQRADHLALATAPLADLFLGRLGIDTAAVHQRQDGHRLGLRLVDVGVERLLDLRGELRGVARVPDVLARLGDGAGQLGQQRRDIRARVERCPGR